MRQRILNRLQVQTVCVQKEKVKELYLVSSRSTAGALIGDTVNIGGPSLRYGET